MTSVSIPVMKPILPTIDAVNVYLERVYESGIFSNHGPLVRELEQRYAEWFNVSPENVVAVVNGTVAISAAALWEDNPIYLSPEWTFPATAMGVLSVGGAVEFRDVDPVAWTLSVTDDDVAHAASVVPVVVAPFGDPIDLNEWSAFPRIIIDAAACAGNRPDLSGMKKGWAATISLHATKVLGCGEGGLVIFADPTDTVYFIMLQVAVATGVPTHMQRILYGGHQLDEDLRLEQYGVSHGDILASTSSAAPR